MRIEIKRLTPELVMDYINFFEQVAFTDNKEWAGCYCVWYHLSETLEAEFEKYNDYRENFNKELAIRMIKEGSLQGYLAYEEDEVVGWCNANNKVAFCALSKEKAPEFWNEEDTAMKIKSVVCYTIAPDKRRSGIATQLLEQVCRDAAKEGYSCVEAYPGKGESNIHRNYHGPYALYEKCGFQRVKELEEMSIVRKYISMSGDLNY